MEVLQLSSDETFGKDLNVEVCYDDNISDIPFLKLLNVKADEETIEAIEDWRCWNSK